MPNTRLNKKLILFILLVLTLFTLSAEAAYSISYSQKSPGAQASALSYKDKVFWTSIKGEQNGTTAIVRFDPYSYSIETFLTLPVRLIKGLHFLSEKRLLILALESSANYVLLELDVETKSILKSQPLPKSWGAVTAFTVEDAEHFWVATANPNQLKRFLSNSLEVLSSIEIKEGSAHGLTIDGNDLWVSVNRFNEPALIQKRQVANGEIQDQFPFHEAAGSISGLFFKDKLWIISFGINRLIELDVEASEKKSFRSTWKKAWSSVAERLQNSPFNSFGLKEGEKTPNVKRRVFEALMSSPLPTKHDWRNFQGHNWLTSVKDQGQCGSCVAFSSVSLIEAQYRISHKLPKLDLNLSEQNAFSCSKGKCNMGTGFTEVLESAMKQGIPDELCLPYKSGNLGLDQECRPCSEQEKRSITLDHYEEVSDYGFGTIEDLKKALLQGPLLTRMYVFDDFFYYRSGVYKHESGEYRGRHVVAIVGYDDETQSLIVKNSWGPYWGENGYFRIAYDDISSVGATTYQAIINTSVVPFSLFLNQNIITNADEKLSVEVVQTKENVSYDLDLSSSRLSITNSANLDVSGLADGIYELFLNDPLSGQIRTEQFLIQREIPTIKLALNALQKKANKTTFSINCSEDRPIPKVFIELTDGENIITEEKSWPCPETKFTIFHSNLKYPLKAKAQMLLGRHQITSNNVEIE